MPMSEAFSISFILFFLSPLYFNKTLLHKSSEWSSLFSGPGLNSSPLGAKNPGVLAWFNNNLSSPGAWSSPWRQGYVGWVCLLPGPPGTATQGCVLGPRGARRTCLCGWRVVSGETCSMLRCSWDQSTPSLQLWVLRLRTPVPAVSTLCDVESTDTPGEERASNGPGSTPAPAPGTGHLGRRKHETSSQRSLLHSPSSDLGRLTAQRCQQDGEWPDRPSSFGLKLTFRELGQWR